MVAVCSPRSKPRWPASAAALQHHAVNQLQHHAAQLLHQAAVVQLLHQAAVAQLLHQAAVAQLLQHQAVVVQLLQHQAVVAARRLPCQWNPTFPYQQLAVAPAEQQ